MLGFHTKRLSSFSTYWTATRATTTYSQKKNEIHVNKVFVCLRLLILTSTTTSFACVNVWECETIWYGKMCNKIINTQQFSDTYRKWNLSNSMKWLFRACLRFLTQSNFSTHTKNCSLNEWTTTNSSSSICIFLKHVYIAKMCKLMVYFKRMTPNWSIRIFCQQYDSHSVAQLNQMKWSIFLKVTHKTVISRSTNNNNNDIRERERKKTAHFRDKLLERRRCSFISHVSSHFTWRSVTCASYQMQNCRGVFFLPFQCAHVCLFLALKLF